MFVIAVLIIYCLEYIRGGNTTQRLYKYIYVCVLGPHMTPSFATHYTDIISQFKPDFRGGSSKMNTSHENQACHSNKDTDLHADVGLLVGLLQKS